MSNELVSGNDLAQAMSRSLMDVTMGRELKKSKMQKQIDMSDALNRRFQTQINAVKAMIEAKKSGLDFAGSMKAVRVMMKEADEDAKLISSMATAADDDS